MLKFWLKILVAKILCSSPQKVKKLAFMIEKRLVPPAVLIDSACENFFKFYTFSCIFKAIFRFIFPRQGGYPPPSFGPEYIFNDYK